MKPRNDLARWILILAVLPGVAIIPRAAQAKSDSHSGASHTDSRFGWAIRTDGNWHISEIEDMNSIEDLPKKYGDDFLYIRDGEKKYVIVDPAMLDRAERAHRRIKMHASQISALASASAELAMSRVNGTWERRRLEKTEWKLERAIENGKRHGDDTRQAERDLKLVRDQLARLEERDGEALPESERRELEERRDRASEGLDEAVESIRKEMHAILREAIEKDLAEPVR